MGQRGFYDRDQRLAAISAKGDPLELIKATVAWERFRTEIEAVTRPKPQERKSPAGRKPYDAILMFKILVLQTLHNLADEQLEYLIRDRLSFMRFLDLGLEDPVPDATTVWLFREALAKAGLVAKLFVLFNQHLEAQGYIARGGQIVDATIVSAPMQRNSRSENDAIKAGKTPEGWQEKPAKNAQKDKDARWTKKHERSFYGYKTHSMATQKLTKVTVDKLAPGAEDYVIWDAALPGFGIRVKPSNVKSYIVQYRNRKTSTSRRKTIGQHGPLLTFHQAKERARIILADALKGNDPVADDHAIREAATMRHLAADYLEQHAVPKKRPRSVANDRSMINRIILPRLGSKKVAAVQSRDIHLLHVSMKKTPYQANRFMPSAVMYFYSGQPMHFYSGVDSLPRRAQDSRDPIGKTLEVSRCGRPPR